MMMVPRGDQTQLHPQDPPKSTTSSTSINPEWILGGDQKNNIGVVNYAKEAVGSEDAVEAGKNGCLSLSQDSILVKFLTETSIHGMKNIVQENRHWSERLFWVVAFLLGVSSSAYLIHEMWDRYDKTPVIISFDPSEVETASIPFPAVTICDNNPIPKGVVEDLKFTLKDRNSSDPEYIDAEEKLGFVRFWCEESEDVSGKGNSSRLNRNRLEDLINLMINVTDPCDKIIASCKFGAGEKNCSSIFEPTITDYGKCCTFNLAPLFKKLNGNDSGGEHIVSQYYVSKPEKEDSWSQWEPKKQTTPGQTFGLSLLINLKTDDYYCPLEDFKGVYVIYHSPYEMPLWWDFTTMIGLGKRTSFEIIPDIMKADPDIRNFQQEKRRCYFGNEKQLKYYQSYTRRNCLDECRVDYFIRTCGCAFSYVPSIELEHPGIKICSYDDSSIDRQCIYAMGGDISTNLDRICPACDPLCEEIKYNHQMSIANLVSSSDRWKEKFWGLRNGTHNVAEVNIFFATEKVVPKLRKALYGWTDLVGNTGGILGLCLGFSVISAIELLYFFTFRAFWNKQRQRAFACRGQSVGTEPKHHVINISHENYPTEERTIKIQWM